MIQNSIYLVLKQESSVTYAVDSRVTHKKLHSFSLVYYLNVYNTSLLLLLLLLLLLILLLCMTCKYLYVTAEYENTSNENKKTLAY